MSQQRKRGADGGGDNEENDNGSSHPAAITYLDSKVCSYLVLEPLKAGARCEPDQSEEKINKKTRWKIRRAASSPASGDLCLPRRSAPDVRTPSEPGITTPHLDDRKPHEDAAAAEVTCEDLSHG